MKALNCANCGANLNYKLGSPVAVCQFCNSVNVLENIKIKIDKSNSIDNSPPYYEETRPHIMLPEIKFRVNYNNFYPNTQSGDLWISNSEIFFKPDTGLFDNFGDVSTKFMNINNITKTEKKLIPPFINIHDVNGKIMKLSSWNRNEIIKEIEKRKKNLV